jgi:hypothetical protein
MDTLLNEMCDRIYGRKLPTADETLKSFDALKKSLPRDRLVAPIRSSKYPPPSNHTLEKIWKSVALSCRGAAEYLLS